MYLLLVLLGSLCDSLVVKSFLASTIAEKRRCQFCTMPFLSRPLTAGQSTTWDGILPGCWNLSWQNMYPDPGSKGKCMHRLWDKLSVLTLWAGVQMFLKNHIKSTWFCVKAKTFLVLFSHIFFRQWQQFGK